MAPLLATPEQVTRISELLAVKAHSDNGKVITVGTTRFRASRSTLPALSMTVAQRLINALQSAEVKPDVPAGMFTAISGNWFMRIKKSDYVEGESAVIMRRDGSHVNVLMHGIVEDLDDEYYAIDFSDQDKEKRAQAAPLDSNYASYTFLRNAPDGSRVWGLKVPPQIYVHHGFVDVRKANGALKSEPMGHIVTDASTHVICEIEQQSLSSCAVCGERRGRLLFDGVKCLKCGFDLIAYNNEKR